MEGSNPIEMMTDDTYLGETQMIKYYKDKAFGFAKDAFDKLHPTILLVARTRSHKTRNKFKYQIAIILMKVVATTDFSVDDLRIKGSDSLKI